MGNLGKIYCIMGKSGSGKDTVFKELMKRVPEFRPVITYTTRPMRVNEIHGEDYFFINNEELAEFETSGKLIEGRNYNTVHGIWSYATVDDGQIDLAGGKYLIITTLEAYDKISSYFKRENVVPIYLNVDDGVRLIRAIEREKTQSNPKYEEMCRRFLADCEDFNSDKLKATGILKVYENDNLENCINEILKNNLQ